MWWEFISLVENFFIRTNKIVYDVSTSFSILMTLSEQKNMYSFLQNIQPSLSIYGSERV